MKKIIFGIIATVVLISCNKENKTPEQKASEAPTTDYAIIGRKALIHFPEMSAEVEYTSDSTLHWKTTDKKGVVNQGDEKMNYKRLNDNLHFLNWIEKDGFTVSQIIDSKDGTVKAFWSFADEKSPRGKRSSIFVDGKFELIK